MNDKYILFLENYAYVSERNYFSVNCPDRYKQELTVADMIRQDDAKSDAIGRKISSYLI